MRYQKKHNESDIKLEFQNLVLFMIIGTKSSKSRCFFSKMFAIFINLGISVREYRTRKPGIPHLNERYVTKPQTSHNNMQKTRPQYLNLEIFSLLKISFDTPKKTKTKKNTLYKEKIENAHKKRKNETVEKNEKKLFFSCPKDHSTQKLGS